MLRSSEKELKPRNGQALMVGIVCRISGCQNQKELSLDDQQDNAQELVRDMHAGPTRFRIFSTKGKGERLDRPELEDIDAAYRSGEFDLFVYDDLSRLIRGGEAAKLLGIGVDHGTRSICINDGIDTVDSTWETDALNACSENVGHNERTSKRLKQKLRNRFRKFGGAMARPIYGYVVPEDAKTYDDWKKDSEAERWIKEGRERLQKSLNCSALAEWFNGNLVPTGPYCRNDRWDGAMVRRYYGNYLLAGRPGRGFKHTVKRHEHGKRVSVINPDGPVFFETPHLAYFEIPELDELNGLLKQKNRNSGRKPVNGDDPLLGVPRKRTRFPGQFARCWYCGRHYVWGANGIKDSLMCNGTRKWNCWNSVGFSGVPAVTRIVELISTELHKLDQFADQYRELVLKAGNSEPSDVARRRQKLESDQRELDRQKANLQEAIAEYGLLPWIREKVESLKQLDARVHSERRVLERVTGNELVLPKSTDELRGLFEHESKALAQNSYEYGDLLRKVVSDFRVHLVRLCDGGLLLPRARIKLALGGIVSDAKHAPGLSELLGREASVDLFERPAREQICHEAGRLAESGLGAKAIAAQIKLPNGTCPSVDLVQDALKLEERRKQLGLKSAYVVVLEPPEDCGRLRRHKNSQYDFKPVDGYSPPEL